MSLRNPINTIFASCQIYIQMSYGKNIQKWNFWDTFSKWPQLKRMCSRYLCAVQEDSLALESAYQNISVPHKHKMAATVINTTAAPSVSRICYIVLASQDIQLRICKILVNWSWIHAFLGSAALEL